MLSPSLKNSDITVGWICATVEDGVAACELLDEEYNIRLPRSPRDENIYTIGKVGHHYVAVACLAKGRYGLVYANALAKDMMFTFPSIHVGLMVGVAGGAPGEKHDVRLGDVVVSSPSGRTGGVLQYDHGKLIQEKDFQYTGMLASPPDFLLNAVQVLNEEHRRNGHRINQTVTRMIQKNPRLSTCHSKPGSDRDVLFESSFVHPDDLKHCTEICHPHTAKIVVRERRPPDSQDPVIHYGTVASADRLMKDASIRDVLVKQQDVLCFETEAAGLMDHFPCLVIRGVSNYSDTHKNDDWHGYAAAVAAAYAKELLYAIPLLDMQQAPEARRLQPTDTARSIESSSAINGRKKLMRHHFLDLIFDAAPFAKALTRRR